MRDIAENLLHVAAAGCDGVLVTIVGNTGSAPRHVGSQMLVSSAGLICGTVGGGAIEGHALATARAMVGSQACLVENLALKKNLGMACGGAAVLLYTPVSARNGHWGRLAAELLRCIDERIPSCLLLTCADKASPTECGAALVDTQGTLLAGANDVAEAYAGMVSRFGDEATGSDSIGRRDSERADSAHSDAQTDRPFPRSGLRPKRNFEQEISGRSHRHPKSDSMHEPGQGAIVGDFFVLPVAVPPRAVVFGGGHVGVATIEALSRVGFSCTLFECRPEFAVAQRVPAARQIIVGDYENIAAAITLDERDYVLIMTHTHRFDGAVLEQALRTPLAYAGCIGSRRKIAGVRERLQEAGISEELIDSVHMPIGLDIRAETPEEIAVSIAAECILHRARKSQG